MYECDIYGGGIIQLIILSYMDPWICGSSVDISVLIVSRWIRGSVDPLLLCTLGSVDPDPSIELIHWTHCWLDPLMTSADIRSDMTLVLLHNKMAARRKWPTVAQEVPHRQAATHCPASRGHTTGGQGLFLGRWVVHHLKN